MRMPLCLTTLALVSGSCFAAVGDPQSKTDHPWYPGELTSSTFERLFKTQAELYKRVVKKDVVTDEDKAIAAWYWRNLNYSHSEDGVMDIWGKGFANSDINRSYWNGLYAYGFGLCFTTHAQWCAEMEHLLGHNTGRAVTVPGHTSFECFLTGGAYNQGTWVLLDHDISTIMFKEDGSRLISIKEIKAEFDKYTNADFKPERQRGWKVGGLHDKDPQAYDGVKADMYAFGYDGPPPMINLRSGETLRRYLKPGLEDGKTFVFWGRNYMVNEVPGPQRERSWVNQPEKMYLSKKNCGYLPGIARHGNAVYTYKPNFKDGSYKEAVQEEDDKQVTFGFYTPYVIAATPKDMKRDGKAVDWGVYEAGCTNGLTIAGKAGCAVKVSTDQGKTWKEAGTLSDKLDLTEQVKGFQQYFLKFEAAAASLSAADITITTVCQCSSSIVPRVKEGKNTVTFEASGNAYISAGPPIAQAEAHVVDGKFGTPAVTLELATPHKEKALKVYAMAHVASSSPPKDTILYQIEYSVDGGKEWKPVVKDWKITRRGDEAEDFWSQSMCYGNISIPDGATGPVRVRFSNNGGKPYLRAEMHLVYEVAKQGACDVTYAWKEGAEVKKASKSFPAAPGKADATWSFDCGAGAEVFYVEYSAK